MLYGKALFAAHRSPEALEVLDEVVAWYDHEARHAQFGGGVDPGEFEEAHALHAEVLASVHGRE
ncbi:MAG: hypothetical protein ACYC8T_27465, partial [Myxococcaceae bacterium]